MVEYDRQISYFNVGFTKTAISAHVFTCEYDSNYICNSKLYCTVSIVTRALMTTLW